jgi:hypothetical protein
MGHGPEGLGVAGLRGAPGLVGHAAGVRNHALPMEISCFYV